MVEFTFCAVGLAATVGLVLSSTSIRGEMSRLRAENKALRTFHIGDKVRLGCWDGFDENCFGKVGTVMGIISGGTALSMIVPLGQDCTVRQAIPLKFASDWLTLIEGEQC